DSVGDIWTQVDVKDGNSCTKYFLRVVLKFHHAGETPAFFSQRGRKKNRHQCPKVFAIIKKHNLRRLFCHHRSVCGSRKLPSDLIVKHVLFAAAAVTPNVRIPDREKSRCGNSGSTANYKPCLLTSANVSFGLLNISSAKERTGETHASSSNTVVDAHRYCSHG